MLKVYPGDIVSIGGGMFRSVERVNLAKNESLVTLHDWLSNESEVLPLRVLEKHILTGYVKVNQRDARRRTV